MSDDTSPAAADQASAQRIHTTSSQRVLSPESAVRPSRPQRWLDVHTPDGPARIRQLEPEQKASVLLRHFAEAGMDREMLTANTPAQQHALRILVRACCVNTDNPRLKYPGDRGYMRLRLWRKDALLEIAQRAADFNGI